MSGFLIAPEAFDEARWARALAFAPASRGQTLALPPLHAVLSRLDAAALWAPASDERSGVTVALAGRISLEPADWRRAETLPYRGGLACRILLEAWLEDEPRFPQRPNGAFCVLIHDPRQATLHLLTDRMGVFPVYAASGAAPRLCSHPDVLADYLAATGRAATLDPLTMAEALARGSSVHPHTYYREIVQLDAASHYRWPLADGSAASRPARIYWQPARAIDERLDAADLADEFAAGLQSAGRRRVERLGKNSLLLSGGADSRALLFTADRPERVESLTFCDRDNPEVDTARAIAGAARSPHRVLYRAAEHYGLGAAETVRVTGGMWSIKDAHYHGFAADLDALGAGNLMTGCYTDYLFKGLGYNRTARRFLGKRLSLDALAPFAAEYYQPHSRIAPSWAARLRERVARWLPDDAIAAYADDPFAVEDRRIRPLAREADAMGRLYLLRMQPWDPVMVDNELLDLYGRIPAALKLNARVFRAAVTRVLPPAARRIRNNNDFSPLHASEAARVLRYLLRKAQALAARRLSGRRPQAGLSTDGSWPNFTYYVAHSQVLAELWADPSPAQRELFADLLGEDAWQTPLAEWARRDIDLILRLLTLKIWLGQRGV